MVLIFIFIRNKYSFPCWCYVFRSYVAQLFIVQKVHLCWCVQARSLGKGTKLLFSCYGIFSARLHCTVLEALNLFSKICSEIRLFGNVIRLLSIIQRFRQGLPLVISISSPKGQSWQVACSWAALSKSTVRQAFISFFHSTKHAPCHSLPAKLIKMSARSFL